MKKGSVKNLDGLGGWLILVGLGVVFGPIRLLIVIVPIYMDLFKSGSCSP